jgi:hypothetical protein
MKKENVFFMQKWEEQKFAQKDSTRESRTSAGWYGLCVLWLGISVLYRLLADLVAIIHLGFILFSVGGGLLVLKWKRCAYVHIAAVVWGVSVELMGWACPLTPLENWLRKRAGADVYATGFIEHYILPIIYPSALTRTVEIVLGILLLSLNVAVYAWIGLRSARKET